MIKEKINSVVEKISNAIFVLQRKALFTTLTDLRFTMRRYIRLVVDNDFSAIKRYNLPISKRLILSVFNELMEEYGSLSDNKEVNAARERKSTFEALVRKQNILVSALMVLNVLPDDKETIDFLKRSGIRGTNIVDRLENEIKIINIRIEEQQSLMKVDDKKSKEKTTLADYMRIFAALNKNGYKADINMPVLDFIQTMSLYRKEAEENAKQMEKLKSKR